MRRKLRKFSVAVGPRGEPQWSISVEALDERAAKEAAIEALQAGRGWFRRVRKPPAGPIEVTVEPAP